MMETTVLILCVAVSFAIGIVPVKWIGNIKQNIYRRNTKYLNSNPDKKK